MKLIVLSSLFLWGICFPIQAQTPVVSSFPKNSIRLGVDHLSLDAPDGTARRVMVRYNRHFTQRWTLEGGLGYLSAHHTLQALLFSMEGKRRERVMAEATIFFDVLKHPNHAFRLGGGPAFWYRNEELLGNVHYRVLDNTHILYYLAEINQVKGHSLGYQLAADYEYRIPEVNVSLGARFTFANLDTAISSMLGLTAGYHF